MLTLTDTRPMTVQVQHALIAVHSGWLWAARHPHFTTGMTFARTLGLIDQSMIPQCTAAGAHAAAATLNTQRTGHLKPIRNRDPVTLQSIEPVELQTNALKTVIWAARWRATVRGRRPEQPRVIRWHSEQTITLSQRDAGNGQLEVEFITLNVSSDATLEIQGDVVTARLPRKAAVRGNGVTLRHIPVGLRRREKALEVLLPETVTFTLPPAQYRQPRTAPLTYHGADAVRILEADQQHRQRGPVHRDVLATLHHRPIGELTNPRFSAGSLMMLPDRQWWLSPHPHGTGLTFGPPGLLNGQARPRWSAAALRSGAAVIELLAEKPAQQDEQAHMGLVGRTKFFPFGEENNQWRLAPYNDALLQSPRPALIRRTLCDPCYRLPETVRQHWARPDF